MIASKSCEKNLREMGKSHLNFTNTRIYEQIFSKKFDNITLVKVTV